ncbi:hypothetical protein [Marinicella rhabdoformis]|uniref:hypothetical protein n=1 Tax=Marinicella rhabdoformis TaxID=2580566 RepID=UPI0012AECAF3|nr:hypothetical protein [Marinicella rhabdoformis]
MMNAISKMLAVGLMVVANQSMANQTEVHKEILQCGDEGCEVVCHEPSKRWDSYLLAKEKIEVTYFLRTGVKQLKAEVEKGQFTILDTHPQWQSCRITGVVASS